MQALDHDNLLVIGSGLSFHNMRAFFSAETPEIQVRNQAFEDWLQETCGDATLLEQERAERLAHWERAPDARFCHPRENIRDVLLENRSPWLMLPQIIIRRGSSSRDE